jgi:HK97 family phage prohead protease
MTALQFGRPAPAIGQRVNRDGKFEKAVEGDGARRATFVASDESVDRYGDIIRASGWDLSNYKNNPVLLFGHDSSAVPIGKVTDIGVEGSRLVATAQFRPEGDSEAADDVYSALKGGFLNAVSVGFLPTKAPNYIWSPDDPKHENWPTGFEVVGQELLELSVVPVPANAQALALARSLALSEATQRRLLVFDERACARVAAQQRRNQLTLARLKGGLFSGGNNVA